METFESLFMRSYVKEDGSRPALSPQTSLLHTNALLSWALLLTICTGSQVKAILHKYVSSSHSSCVRLVRRVHTAVADAS